MLFSVLGLWQLVTAAAGNSYRSAASSPDLITSLELWPPPVHLPSKGPTLGVRCVQDLPGGSLGKEYKCQTHYAAPLELI